MRDHGHIGHNKLTLGYFNPETGNTGRYGGVKHHDASMGNCKDIDPSGYKRPFEPLLYVSKN